jgi:hypothetical protein
VPLAAWYAARVDRIGKGWEDGFAPNGSTLATSELGLGRVKKVLAEAWTRRDLGEVAMSGVFFGLGGSFRLEVLLMGFQPS